MNWRTKRIIGLLSIMAAASVFWYVVIFLIL